MGPVGRLWVGGWVLGWLWLWGVAEKNAVVIPGGGGGCLGAWQAGRWARGVHTAAAALQLQPEVLQQLHRLTHCSAAVRAPLPGLQGLPPIKGIAAGQQHALLTDGERVWGIGRWLTAAGDEAGMAGWDAPAELLHRPAEGISRVVAGSHASAAVTGGVGCEERGGADGGRGGGGGVTHGRSSDTLGPKWWGACERGGGRSKQTQAACIGCAHNTAPPPPPGRRNPLDAAASNQPPRPAATSQRTPAHRQPPAVSTQQPAGLRV